MQARCVRAYFLIRRRTCASNKPFKLDSQWGERTSVDIRNSAATNLSNSTPSGENAQASTSGTVHTNAAETCIGNRPQETSVTIDAKTPYPQDLTKDPLARRPRTRTPTTTTSVIDTKTPYPQDLIKDATARRPRTKTCQDRKRVMTDRAKLFCHSLLWGEFLRDSAIACVRIFCPKNILQYQ
jgi:hypothetical protein